ncbi:MAG: hypothetical protein MJ238_05850 [Bacilli bacterium]|nr:hypothetical protein [Bacilli bacterium]
MDKKEKEILSLYDKKNGSEVTFSKLESKIEYTPKQSVNKIRRYSYFAIPAVLIASTLIAVFAINANKSSNLLDGKYQITSAINNHDGSHPDGVYVPHWDEMNKLQQYSSVIYDHKAYSLNSTSVKSVPLDYIDTKIGVAEAKGYDIYEQVHHTEEVETYSLKKINSELAIAIKYPGFDGYYCMTNKLFEMNTLGDFIDSLNLEEYVSFGSLSFTYLDKSGELWDIEYKDIDNKEIYSYFFSDKSKPLVLEDSSYATSTLLYGIAINNVAIGAENLALQVFDNGIVETNLLGVGKWWDIGSGNAKKFLDNIERKYQGYAIKY